MMLLAAGNSKEDTGVTFKAISGGKSGTSSALQEENDKYFADNGPCAMRRVRFADEIEEVCLFSKDSIAGDKIRWVPPAHRSKAVDLHGYHE